MITADDAIIPILSDRAQPAPRLMPGRRGLLRTVSPPALTQYRRRREEYSTVLYQVSLFCSD